MNYKTSYNITEISMTQKLKYLYKKLRGSVFYKKKYIQRTIDLFIQLQFLNIDLCNFEHIPKINTILLSHFRKNLNFKKQFKNSVTFVQFLLYLSKDSDFHPHILDLFYMYFKKKSKFNKTFHFEIIQIIGNSVEDNTDTLYNSQLNSYIFNSIKTCNHKKLSYFLPFLNNFHNEINNILLP